MNNKIRLLTNPRQLITQLNSKNLETSIQDRAYPTFHMFESVNVLVHPPPSQALIGTLTAPLPPPHKNNCRFGILEVPLVQLFSKVGAYSASILIWFAASASTVGFACFHCNGPALLREQLRGAQGAGAKLRDPFTASGCVIEAKESQNLSKLDAALNPCSINA